ncbi:MAG TPA: hypothetical protein P5571_03630 [Candidatus Krumholzibacteria bacterium]|nr:hypothetical protein [Candidatus Krumholzibacteria bacterium]
MMAGLVGRFLGGGEPAAFRLPGTLGDAAEILAVDTGDLADLLFYAPLLRAIRQRHPRARIDMLLPERHVSVVQPSGLVRDCLVYNAKQLRTWTPGYLNLARGVGKRTYDLSVVMSFEAAPALEGVALATGAPLRLGPSHAKAYPGVNFELRAREDDRRYRGARLGAMAPFLGLPPFEDLRAWPLPDEHRRRTAQRVRLNKPRRDELLVGVDPSLGHGGNGLALQALQFLWRQLASQMACRALPLTLHEDGERLKRFEEGLDQTPLDLPRDTLFDTLLLAAECDLLVAGNTDLFHFAVSLGVPCLGLFTAEDAPCWEPRDLPHVRVLRVTEGRRMEVDVLMAAVTAVRSGR